MEKLIFETLKKINLDIEYKALCFEYNDFERAINLGKKEVEPIIKSYDPDFSYISKDRTFLKEMFFEGYTVRFFIGFKRGVIGFGYLIWKEGENHNFYKGNLHTLSKQINSEFEKKGGYNFPMATSLNDLKEILFKIFVLFEKFKKHFLDNL